MKQYLDLLGNIKENGTLKPAARENMPSTTSLFGYQFRHDLSKGFPLLTTKKMYWKGVVFELLWFLRGYTNIKYLIDNNVTKLWTEDAYNYYEKLCPQLGITPVGLDEFIEKVKIGEKVYLYTYGDCGEQYGTQWKRFGYVPKYIIQIQKELKKVYLGSSGDRLKGTWEKMIDRCYNKDSLQYKNYGARGVSVHESWFNFKVFKSDVMQIDGWEDKISNWDKFQLDKDFIGRGFLYSKDTCSWITSIKNCSSTNTIYVFKKDEELYRTTSIRQLARDMGVDHANLVRVANKERKTAYGFSLHEIINLNSGVDQIHDLIKGLRSNPSSRRHIVTAWNPESLNNLALHPCHAMFQFNCRPMSFRERKDEFMLGKNKYTHPYDHTTIPETVDDWIEVMNKPEVNVPKFKLDCHLYQRSADVILGVPFNIASYALLTEIIAKMCNMVAGEFIHSFGDVHIYENHTAAVEEQLSRTPSKLPTLDLCGKAETIFKTPMDNIDFVLSNLEFSDFTLLDYTPQSKIEAELSTGMKK